MKMSIRPDQHGRRDLEVIMTRTLYFWRALNGRATLAGTALVAAREVAAQARVAGRLGLLTTTGPQASLVAREGREAARAAR